MKKELHITILENGFSYHTATGTGTVETSGALQTTDVIDAIKMREALITAYSRMGYVTMLNDTRP